MAPIINGPTGDLAISNLIDPKVGLVKLSLKKLFSSFYMFKCSGLPVYIGQLLFTLPEQCSIHVDYRYLLILFILGFRMQKTNAC